jgi:hypothetical protein
MPVSFNYSVVAAWKGKNRDPGKHASGPGKAAGMLFISLKFNV